MELFLRSDKVCTIIWPIHTSRPLRETNCSTPITQQIVSMEGTTLNWTGEHVKPDKRRKIPTLLDSPTNSNVEWAKVINLRLIKGGDRLRVSYFGGLPWSVEWLRHGTFCTRRSSSWWIALRNVVSGLHNVSVPLTVGNQGPDDDVLCEYAAKTYQKNLVEEALRSNC